METAALVGFHVVVHSHGGVDPPLCHSCDRSRKWVGCGSYRWYVVQADVISSI